MSKAWLARKRKRQSESSGAPWPVTKPAGRQTREPAGYAALAERTPGPVWLQYYTGVALITESGTYTVEIPDVRLRLVSVPFPEGTRPGFPLDSISVTEDGRYYCALSDEDRTEYNAPFERAFTEFILSHLGLV